MESESTINRRDAVLGLVLLAGLFGVLIAAIVYRSIDRGTTPPGPAAGGQTLETHSQATPSEPPASRTVGNESASSLPNAPPQPAVATSEEPSHREASPQTAGPPPTSPAEQPLRERPVFVAPGGGGANAPSP